MCILAYIMGKVNNKLILFFGNCLGTIRYDGGIGRVSRNPLQEWRPTMIFRESYPEEINEILIEGYQVWSKNRTLEQYCIDNRKEDAYGTRYVMEDNDEVVSSLILLHFDNLFDKKVYGIGSVLTHRNHKSHGYATELLNNCIRLVHNDDSMIFLYSEISPAFYERFQFRVLPDYLQKDSNSICMVLCGDVMWDRLLTSSIKLIPEHF